MQAVENAQERRLAAAGRADDADEFALVDAESEMSRKASTSMYPCGTSSTGWLWKASRSTCHSPCDWKRHGASQRSSSFKSSTLITPAKANRKMPANRPAVSKELPEITMR